MYVLCNFVHGFGPLLRTAQLAVEINQRLKKAGKETFPILAPWPYGERQRKILLEELSESGQENLVDIYLDETLGRSISSLFHYSFHYRDALERIARSLPAVNDSVRSVLQSERTVSDLHGKKHSISKSEIAFEINRSSPVSFDAATSYYVSYGYTSQILENVLRTPELASVFDSKNVSAALELYQRLESQHRLSLISKPGTFSFSSHYKPRQANELAIPPLHKIPAKRNPVLPRSVYVTVSGVPGVDRLYRAARDWNVPIITNDRSSLGYGAEQSPHALADPNVLCQFARAGWGSIWLSQLLEKPFIAPPYQNGDDPEIFFNNRYLQTSGTGIVIENQDWNEIEAALPKVREQQQAMNRSLMKEFGTLDGYSVAADRIVSDYLGKSPA